MQLILLHCLLKKKLFTLFLSTDVIQIPNATDILLAWRESKILTYAKNKGVLRDTSVEVTSYFVNNSSSSVDTINTDHIDRCLRILPYDSSYEKRVYIPFANVTSNMEHFVVSFFVRNNEATVNISRLEILFVLETNGIEQEENFVFNITFVKDLPYLSTDVSTSLIPVPTTIDVSTPTAILTTADASTSQIPVPTTMDVYTPPTPTPTTAGVSTLPIPISTPAMNCSEIINEIRTVGSAVEEVCETSPIDQGSTVFGILLPLVAFIGLLQVAALVVMVHLWCRVSNSNLDRRIKEHVEHTIANDSRRILPASAGMRGNRLGPWPEREDIDKMPTIANFMPGGSEESSA